MTASVHRRSRSGAAGPVVAAPPRLRSRFTRQVAVLGLVCCALALVLAFPFRSYLNQQAELRQQLAVEASMRAQLADLEAQKVALSDPNYVLIEARRRLHFVQPGDTVYVVHAEATAPVATRTGAAEETGQPWYGRMWDTLGDPAARK